jgi:hypothetical protein
MSQFFSLSANKHFTFLETLSDDTLCALAPTFKWQQVPVVTQFLYLFWNASINTMHSSQNPSHSITRLPSVDDEIKCQHNLNTNFETSQKHGPAI